MVFDDYEFEIDVTIADVRTALTDVNATTLPDETIQQAIDEETLIVKAELPDSVESLAVDRDDAKAAVEMLIRRRAARGSWHSSPTEVRQQALDAARSYDAQAFRGRLNDNVDEAYAILGLDRDGTSAAFIETTTSQFDPDHPQSRGRRR